MDPTVPRPRVKENRQPKSGWWNDGSEAMPDHSSVGQTHYETFVRMQAVDAMSPEPQGNRPDEAPKYEDPITRPYGYVKNTWEVPSSALAQKFDTCANGSCHTPQWPAEVLPGSVAILPKASSPVDEGYTPTLNAVFDNRWNVQMNAYLNQQALAQKFDTCAGGSCHTPQWPAEILPGSQAILPKASSPVDEGYRPTLNAVFDNRWN